MQKIAKLLSSYTFWLWFGILIAFSISHLSKDRVTLVIEHGLNLLYSHSDFVERVITDKETFAQDGITLALRMKKVLFLLSIFLLFHPIVNSLKRIGFLWEPPRLARRLWTSLFLCLCLSILAFPLFLKGVGAQYASMSITPFEMGSGWYYRRLLMPALANYLGLQGNFLYYIFSIILIYILIFFVIAYIESRGVEINFLHLLSIVTSSFVIFNFFALGFVDPLIFIFFLMAPLSKSRESHLAITALALVAHEASVFVLMPIILFLFPRKERGACALVILLYFSLLLLSFRIDVVLLVKSQIILHNRIGIEWWPEFPLRALAGWIISYKLLWCLFFFALVKMLRSGETMEAFTLISIGLLSPLAINILTVDTSRFVGFGFLAMLIAYCHLMNSGYAHSRLLRAIMIINIAIPSVYIAINAGFRPAPGLYKWLYEFLGLHLLLGNL